MTDRDSEVSRIARDGQELVRQAQTLVKTPGTGTAADWFTILRGAGTQEIVASLGALGAPHPDQGPRLHAFRDAARAMVEEKLADRMIAKMDRLEKASNRLAGVGILVAVIITAVELWARS